jgi:signal transduction histidine kinase
MLFASLLFMAIVVQNTYTPQINLEQTAHILENNLHQREQTVNEQINNKNTFNRFKTLPNNTIEALKVISLNTTDAGIWVLTVKKGQLVFWSGIKVIPANLLAIKDGYSFLKEANGYYETIKKTDGDFSVIFFIPVKLEYSFTNQYLKNTFQPNLLKDQNLAIADFTDKKIQAIHSISHSYLFSVKLIDSETNNRFLYFQISLWILTLLVFCVLVQNISLFIAAKGYVIVSIVFLALHIAGIRLINLYFGWPSVPQQLAAFNAKLYASNALSPSFGDFCINIIMLTWLVVYIYVQRHALAKLKLSKKGAYAVIIGCILTLIIVSTALVNLFYGLVINSKINFDVNNVLNLSSYSIFGVLMLCFAMLIFYLLDEAFLTVCLRLPVPALHQLILLAAAIVITTAVKACLGDFTLFYLLWLLVVVIRAYAHLYMAGKLNSASFALIIIICALISSTKLNYFQSIKEKENRKILIQRLETPDDATADYLFKKVEKRIAADKPTIKYLQDKSDKIDFLKSYFQKSYFDGYLSKYDFQLHLFDRNGISLSPDKNFELANFKDLVLYSSLHKASDYFYRDVGTFGYQKYFALIPVNLEDKLLGTIVIELKTKTLQASSSFPELLEEGETKSNDDFKNYSYAFYDDNNLLSQSGKYVYSVINDEFYVKTKNYQFKTTFINGASWYNSLIMYNHLIYRPTQRTLIVVSKQESPILNGITSLTFFFIFFLVFSLSLIVMHWFWSRLSIFHSNENFVRLNFDLNLDDVLYKTRIQFSMILAVVVTLLLVGMITYFTIRTQYLTQQDDNIRDKITRITDAFESGAFNIDIKKIHNQSQEAFDAFAASNSADLTLFDVSGIPIVSTQPKLYDYGVIARRINGKAYIYLSKLQKSEYVNEEKIGDLSYKAAYAPVRNNKNQTVGYLQLPYFSNVADYRERLGTLLNGMINIYALVFIGIGLFAVIIARQITYPLNFIQYSLSNTAYGKKNEPIQWERNDEIGALVTEYNKMIAALENSAKRLAQSERESAWREMAKQVAHEIKNPLTPLKLGLQLLEKSWRDKDPKFDLKFERFSKSFVEQIESLSSIASEFSAFAKMPDTRIERIDIFSLLGQAVIIFKHMDNVKILYQPPAEAFYINADRDQLLRCFNNLLKNAIEATPDGRFGIIDITYFVSNKNILLNIKDNGNGIPENMREKIFEPNFTTKSSGTGLGLAFVKNSIENAGGKVWFETSVSVGTTFFLSLPIAG